MQDLGLLCTDVGINYGNLGWIMNASGTRMWYVSYVLK